MKEYLDVADLRIVLRTTEGWYNEIVVWAPMQSEAKEKVLAARWSMFGFKLLLFRRGAWERSVMELSVSGGPNRRPQ